MAEHGPEALSNAVIMDGVCRDRLSNLPGEAILIGSAARTDVPALLRDLIPRLGNYGAIQSVAATLAEAHGLDIAACVWVVREFARALGLIASGGTQPAVRVGPGGGTGQGTAPPPGQQGRSAGQQGAPGRRRWQVQASRLREQRASGRAGRSWGGRLPGAPWGGREAAVLARPVGLACRQGPGVQGPHHRGACRGARREGRRRRPEGSRVLNRNTIGIAAAIALVAGYLGVAAVAHLSPFPAKTVAATSSAPRGEHGGKHESQPGRVTGCDSRPEPDVGLPDPADQDPERGPGREQLPQRRHPGRRDRGEPVHWPAGPGRRDHLLLPVLQPGRARHRVQQPSSAKREVQEAVGVHDQQ